MDCPPGQKIVAVIERCRCGEVAVSGGLTVVIQVQSRRGQIPSPSPGYKGLKLCRKYCCLPISEKNLLWIPMALLRSTSPTQSKTEQKYLCI